jgi:excisionase family DNA binding protein
MPPHFGDGTVSLPEITESAAPKRKPGRPKGSKNKNKPQRPAPLGDTVNDFCAKMRCSRPYAYKLMREGKLKYFMLGKRRRIPHSEYQRLGVVS